MRLRYHPQAESEIVEAARFYEGRVAGLGHRFLDELAAAIQEIERAPRRWSIYQGDVRRYLLSTFPYGIYYRLEGQTLEILIVKDQRRHPDYGRDRLR